VGRKGCEKNIKSSKGWSDAGGPEAPGGSDEEAMGREKSSGQEDSGKKGPS